MEKVKDFVAIDFEWKSSDKDVCAVGMVKVINNVIIGKYYSLVRPKTDNWDAHCCAKNGITPDMCKYAPSFEELEPMIESFVGLLPLVSHNYAQAEYYVFKNHARDNSPLRDAKYFDTMQSDGRSLAERCADLDIPFTIHHDALEDATATALLYIKVQGNEVVIPKTGEKKEKVKVSKRDSSLNYMIEADKVPYPDTPFMGEKFVVSGFPEDVRDKIITFIRDNFGGQSANSISGKTKVLVGHSEKCGPSKLVKAREAGCTIYNESTLLTDVIVPCGLEEEWKRVFG